MITQPLSTALAADPSLFCGRCRSRLCITKTSNRHGSTYFYFFCLGRQQRRTDCEQPSIPVELVETHVASKWVGVRLSPEYVELLRTLIAQGLDEHHQRAKHARSLATRQVQRLRERQRKLLEAHYEGAIPVDLLREEQTRISNDLQQAERRLRSASVSFDRLAATIEACLTLLERCVETYRNASPAVRRQMNQALFERFFITEDGVAEATLADPFRILLDPSFVVSRRRPRRTAEASKRAPALVAHWDEDWDDGVPAWLRDSTWWEKVAVPTGRHHAPQPRSQGHLATVGLGLKEHHLVGRQGLEP